jgi:chromosome segregation ATPase
LLLFVFSSFLQEYLLKKYSLLFLKIILFIFFLFKANATARELQKRVEHLEKINIELKSRLDESLAMYEQSQRDLRNKQQELQRVNAELDKTRELKDQLARENKKLGGNCQRSFSYVIYIPNL